MLGKVFKHEMRATALPYGIILAVSICFGLLTFLTMAPYGIEQISYLMRYRTEGIVLIISLCSTVAVLIPILFFILTGIRYSKSMYGREGYLSHSLPVSAESLVLGKFAASVVWGICVCLLSAFLSFVVFYHVLLPIYMKPERDIMDFWAELIQLLADPKIGHIVVSIFFTGLLHISLFANYIFLAVTLANLPCFQKGNTILSIVFFVMIQYVEEQLMMWVLRPNFDYMIAEDIVHWFYALTNVFSVENLWYVATAAVHIAITIWIVKKHTALQ